MIQSGKMETEKLAIAVELIEKVKTFISEYIDFGDISKEKIEKFENFIVEKLVGYEIKRQNGDYDFQKRQYNLEIKTLDEFIGNIALGGHKMLYKDFRDKELNYLASNLR